MSKSRTKVVIVGAGVAGVTAAAWLTNNGIDDVVILEAQDYVGGRVKGVVVDGNIIDFGAQFIHGRKGNPAFQIAEKLGRVVFEDNGVQRLQNVPKEFLTADGKKVDSEKTKKFLTFCWKEFEEGYRELCKTSEAENVEFFEQSYQKFLDMQNGISKEDKELFDALYRWNYFYHKVDNAVVEMNELSAWGAGNYVSLDGDRFTDAHGGMAGILRAIVDLIPEGVIRLNTSVSKIDWNSPVGKSSDGKVSVTCQNGQVIEADHVLVTISVGCLKAVHKEMFQPSLPQPFQTALNHLGYGSIGKIYLKWEKPFWTATGDDYFESFEFLWLDSIPVCLKSDKCTKKTRLGKPWWHGLHSMETVLDQPNMLEIWLSPDQVEVAEELEDAEVKAVCHELIQTFLKEYEVPEPAEIYRTKWLTNPYTRGTYSFPASGLRQEDIDNLGKPLPSVENPRLLFAGEAYTIEYISTFHGAFFTGLDMANLLLRKQGVQVSGDLVDLIGTKKSQK